MKMKRKITAIILAIVLVTALAAACNGGGAPAVPQTDEASAVPTVAPTPEDSEAPALPGDGVSIALLVATNLGDMSFNDSALRGVTRARDELGINFRVIEDNNDPTRFESTFLEMAEEGHNIVIGGSQYTQYIERHADSFPNVTFINFDSSVDWALGNFSNVNSIRYLQNEGSFLGGYLLGSLTETGLVGFLGGMDTAVINDFLVGFIEGAQFANPDIRVSTVYSHSFSDPAAGKELALAMIAQGADFTFNVAGGTGLGSIEAAAESGTRILGVDSDQAMMFSQTGRMEMAEVIVSSVLKNVDASLFRAISNYVTGTLLTGQTEYLGFAEGGVGLADNEFFRASVSADLIDRLFELEKMIIAGDIVVGTSLGPGAVDVAALRASVSP